METKNMDEKDALKIVKWWVESQLNVKKAFRKSLFYALERFSFYEKEKDSNAAALYNYGTASNLVNRYVNMLWKKVTKKYAFKLLSLSANEYNRLVTTAQSIFDNFTFLHFWNGNKLPCTTATIGEAHRNEKSPQKHLLSRFTLALIEHFVDPEDKSHQKYSQVSNLEFLMFPRDEQMSGKFVKRLCLGEAVSKGIVKNESLAYFIGRVYLYLTSLGIDETRLRFRQNLPNVMDHYAEDCWMAEIETSCGWSECVWIADRSHDKIGASLEVKEELAQPTKVKKLVIKPIHKELRPAFEGDRIKVVEALKTLYEKDAMEMKDALESKGEVQLEVSTLKKTVTIKRSMVSISKETQKVHHRTFKSAVIESSFVMERIIYCLFEHSFYTRPSEAGEEEIYVFGFSLLAAPAQCPIFSLAPDQQYKEVAKQINDPLRAAGISSGVYPWDDSTIELQYKGADASGAPFSITVVSTSSVTIRERDTQDQIFVSVEKVAAVVKELCEGRSKWADVLKKYPAAQRADRTTLNIETI
ncbi:glycyl-tRNA synthetase / glycine--tRNA ligase [Artemisia annua]|uniref:Glycyl-tRNA synthetase / glycine--tRNA ligase n=1 Tax=Artemisia annua TaxID=35608 RepID=A0A2U1LJX7_ARTAN|nr:glycyl-tRNA synthetase / glycine--tRNA ligase [Artemisia annua]